MQMQRINEKFYTHYEEEFWKKVTQVFEARKLYLQRKKNQFEITRARLLDNYREILTNKTTQILSSLSSYEIRASISPAIEDALKSYEKDIREEHLRPIQEAESVAYEEKQMKTLLSIRMKKLRDEDYRDRLIPGLQRTFRYLFQTIIRDTAVDFQRRLTQTTPAQKEELLKVREEELNEITKMQILSESEVLSKLEDRNYRRLQVLKEECLQCFGRSEGPNLYYQILTANCDIPH